MQPRRNTQDPDGFFVEDALMPDPLFMALRRVWERGPVGRLVAWFQREQPDDAMIQRVDPGFTSARSARTQSDDTDSRDIAA